MSLRDWGHRVDAIEFSRSLKGRDDERDERTDVLSVFAFDEEEAQIRMLLFRV